MKITVETNVAAPIEMVWEAYTTPEARFRVRLAGSRGQSTRLYRRQD